MTEQLFVAVGGHFDVANLTLPHMGRKDGFSVRPVLQLKTAFYPLWVAEVKKQLLSLAVQSH